MGRLGEIWAKTEDGFGLTALMLMALMPVIELASRSLFGTGFAGSAEIVQHLTLWVGFIGAILAAREGRHLSLSTGLKVLPERYESWGKLATSIVSTVVALSLAWASYQFVLFETESAVTIGGIFPVWMAEVILPVAFAFIALRFILDAGDTRQRVATLILAPAIAFTIGFLLEPYAYDLVWPVITLLIISAIVGAPIFVVLGGTALVLFFGDFVPAAAVPVETYRIVVSPSLPAIPLFTLAGFVLAAGGTSERLVRLFRALFGWMPGGLVIATTLVCAFFSTFTGASGVTIMALGGVLLPVLLQNGYRDKFSVGLLTSTGSIGLLFPPSLAVILYGVIARVPISDMFIAGIIPGVIMVSAVIAYGIYEGTGIGTGPAIQRQQFDAREAWAAVKVSKWEVLLPVVVLGAIFGGYTSLIEAAAITAVYTLLIEVVIHRDIHPTRDLPDVVVKCVTMLGGVFVILGVAMGLTNYLVDAMIPMQAAEWVEANVDSRITFLLALNVFLLIVGALMDIFSAIVVVVPLIIPISQVFGIHPLHLGMIFLVNLELGYLTPPVGMNLFLAAYRLDRPLIEVYRAALPFLFVLLAVVLLITYVPALTIGAN